MSFQAGDVVQLKSGGPKMTVAKVEGTVATCTWFGGDKLEPHTKGFAVATLQKWE